MKTAATRTIEEWNKPSMMPPLAFILERCRAYAELVPSKPLPAFRQLRDGAGFSPEEIDEMLEAGKEAQREHIAKLEADSEWCAMRDRLVSKDFVKPTTVPKDPQERESWARQTAEKQGWRR